MICLSSALDRKAVCITKISNLRYIFIAISKVCLGDLCQ